MTWSWEPYSVTIARLTGQGPTGPAYATGVAASADVQGDTRMVRAADGRKVASTVTVRLLPGEAWVPPGSRITLPAPWSRTTTAIATTPHLVLSGNTGHQEVACE